MSAKEQPPERQLSGGQEDTRPGGGESFAMVVHGDALSRLRSALEDHGSVIRGNNAQCPAHDDRQASLSIGQGRDGAVLKCHAGCETDAVLEALGMSAADLFDEPRERGNGQSYLVTATYAYTD